MNSSEARDPRTSLYLELSNTYLQRQPCLRSWNSSVRGSASQSPDEIPQLQIVRINIDPDSRAKTRERIDLFTKISVHRPSLFSDRLSSLIPTLDTLTSKLSRDRYPLPRSFNDRYDAKTIPRNLQRYFYFDPVFYSPSGTSSASKAFEYRDSIGSGLEESRSDRE